MASPKFTAGRRNIDALVALAAKQPPPVAVPAEPRGAERAGSELGSWPPAAAAPEPAPSDLVRYTEHRW